MHSHSQLAEAREAVRTLGELTPGLNYWNIVPTWLRLLQNAGQLSEPLVGSLLLTEIALCYRDGKALSLDYRLADAICLTVFLYPDLPFNPAFANPDP